MRNALLGAADDGEPIEVAQLAAIGDSERRIPSRCADRWPVVGARSPAHRPMPFDL